MIFGFDYFCFIGRVIKVDGILDVILWEGIYVSNEKGNVYCFI